MRTFIKFLVFTLLCQLVVAGEVELIGDVDTETRDELLSFFRNGAKIFAGGYITDEFKPGLDKYIISIRRIDNEYKVTMAERPCQRTEFNLIRICYTKDRCHWDLDSTYKCIRE